jgi:hypothetical protein
VLRPARKPFALFFGATPAEIFGKGKGVFLSGALSLCDIGVIF